MPIRALTNNVRKWLALIGTAPRAQRLFDSIAFLDGRVHKHCGGTVAGGRCLRCKATELHRKDFWIRVPPPCPTRFLFRDVYFRRRLYADPVFREALDAWDAGLVTKLDIKRYCEYILAGKYRGPAVMCHPKLRSVWVAESVTTAEKSDDSSRSSREASSS